jgi:hypothetical protein
MFSTTDQDVNRLAAGITRGGTLGSEPRDD